MNLSRQPARRRALLEGAVLAALGALQTWAFVNPVWAWPLSFLAGAVLVWRLNHATWRGATWLGWCYGLGWLTAGVWWLFISMHRYGGLPAPLAAFAVLALSAALSLYLALACGVYARWRRAQALPDAVLFAALWLLAELARGLLFTGFPWVASGYAWVDNPLWVGLASVVGVYGLGAFGAFWMALVATAAARIRQGQLRDADPVLVLILAALLLVPLAAGQREQTFSVGRVEVTLIQTNVAQDEKFAAEQMPQTLEWLGRSLTQAQGQLVVAPETAVPLLPVQLDQLSPGYWETLQQHFSAAGRSALVGIPLGSFDDGYTNSVAALGSGAPYRYDKQHLVPFGEFIPAGFRWFTELMNIPLGDFARAPLNAPSFVLGAQRVAPNICYEDLFGEELAVRFADESRAPTILANVSNIGWFGDTVALPQHLNISRMRTLELQRPMLRATNTGVTAVIDHQGRVLARLDPFTRGVLNARVEGRSGTTLYAAWVGRYGLWPLALLALALVVGLALTKPRRRAAGPAAPVDRDVRL